MKNVFTNVTLKTLKKNRTRTLVTIVGILLATAMLTAVTAFISSLQQYMIRVAITEEGNWYGAAFEVPGERVSELSQDRRTAGLAVWQELGYARFDNLSEEELNSYRMPYLYVAGLGEGFTDMMPVVLTEGRMPENSRELVVSDRAVNWGFLDVKAGGTLTLNLGERTLNGERLGPGNSLIYMDEPDGTIRIAEEFVPEETREYTVVGVIQTPEFMKPLSNPAFYALTVMDEEPPADASYTCFYRTAHASDIYRFTEEKLSGCGATFNSELLRYMGTSENRPYMRMLYGLGAILTAIIMAGGISLVYNSFAISVSDRTKQFGLLASVGATPKQLKGMVFREAFLLGSIGIPLGIAAGILGIGVTLHFTGRYFTYLLSGNTVVMSLHVSWPAVITAALTALVTVLVSAWIPAGRAAKIPPMEAIRQVKDVKKRQKRIRIFPGRASGRKGLSYRLFGLPALVAGKHFSREKRQYRVTIFSLFISIVLFISASSFSSYVRRSVMDVNDLPDYDITVYLEEEMKGLAGEITGMDGVSRALDAGWCYGEVLVDMADLTEEGRALYVPDTSSPATEDRLEADRSGDGRENAGDGGQVKLSASVLVLKDEDYKAWLSEPGALQPSKDGSRENGASRKTAAEELPGAVLYDRTRGYDSEQGKYRSYGLMKKKAVEMTLLLTDTGEWSKAMDAAVEAGGSEEDVPEEDYQKKAAVQVDAFAEKGPMNLLAGYSGLYLIMPESGFRKAAGELEDTSLVQRTLYLQAADHQAVAERIQNLVNEKYKEGRAHAFVIDERQSINVEKNMLLTVDVFSYGFITLISLIAAANVFNTISTGFLLRRREFAVLSSVGMTPKEMNRMLSYECLLYGLKALLYGIPVSLLVTWEIYRVVQSSMDTSFYVPAASIVIAVFSVFAVVFATMLYARARMKHENIIDSIRQESL